MAFVPAREMWGACEEAQRRFQSLTEQITLPQIINNREEFLKLSKERASLEELVSLFSTFKKNFQDYEGSRKILEIENDADMRAMAQEEIAALEPSLEKDAQQLQVLLLPKDPNDEKNIILEIRAGVGGDEAGLFAQEIYRAYARFAERQRWVVELLSFAENSAGGYKEVIAEIRGDRVFSKLKYESGAHRVQRVPKTEGSGRVHTSTVTVAVLPEAEEVDLVIDPKDLRIDVYRAGGKGGQSVNTTDSAVRITYLPTDEVVVCQDEKSQLKNKNKAMKILRTRILEKMRAEAHAKEAATRKAQVGGGFRNERIRTYNFPQGRVTDHRIGMTTYNLAEIMDGGFGPYIEGLTNYYQTLALKGEAPPSGMVDSGDDD